MNKFRKVLISTILCMSLVLSVIPTSFAVDRDWKDTTAEYCTVITKALGTLALSFLSLGVVGVGVRMLLGRPLVRVANDHPIVWVHAGAAAHA
jgi:hypothetical protein